MSAAASPIPVPPAPSRLGLRLRLHSGPCFIPLDRIDHLTGYATLSGEPDDYFLGWLTFHGRQIPVFDLNRIVCDKPTPERFGTRILLLRNSPESSGHATATHIGLLADGVTDTVSLDATGPSSGSRPEPIDLDQYLPMLALLIPPLPEAAA